MILSGSVLSWLISKKFMNKMLSNTYAPIFLILWKKRFSPSEPSGRGLNLRVLLFWSLVPVGVNTLWSLTMVQSQIFWCTGNQRWYHQVSYPLEITLITKSEWDPSDSVICSWMSKHSFLVLCPGCIIKFQWKQCEPYNIRSNMCGTAGSNCKPVLSGYVSLNCNWLNLFFYLQFKVYCKYNWESLVNQGHYLT